MDTREIFEEIFFNVATELGCDGWYELYDSDDFEEVERRICQTFGVEDAVEVEGFLDWYNEMYWDL